MWLEDDNNNDDDEEEEEEGEEEEIDVTDGVGVLLIVTESASEGMGGRLIRWTTGYELLDKHDDVADFVVLLLLL